MSVENDIRALLRQEPMTVDQLADRLGVSRDMVNTITAYEMTDVYEEDDGTLKLCTKPKKTYNHTTPEMVEIIKELAGTMSTRKIAETIGTRLGKPISDLTVEYVIKKHGLNRFSTKKWTDEMTIAVFTTDGSMKEKTKSVNLRFGTHFTEHAIQEHRASILRTPKDRGRLVVKMRDEGFSWDEIGRWLNKSERQLKMIHAQWSRR